MAEQAAGPTPFAAADWRSVSCSRLQALMQQQQQLEKEQQQAKAGPKAPAAAAVCRRRCPDKITTGSSVLPLSQHL